MIFSFCVVKTEYENGYKYSLSIDDSEKYGVEYEPISPSEIQTRQILELNQDAGILVIQKQFNLCSVCQSKSELGVNILFLIMIQRSCG